MKRGFCGSGSRLGSWHELAHSILYSKHPREREFFNVCSGSCLVHACMRVCAWVCTHEGLHSCTYVQMPEQTLVAFCSFLFYWLATGSQGLSQTELRLAGQRAFRILPHTAIPGFFFFFFGRLWEFKAMSSLVLEKCTLLPTEPLLNPERIVKNSLELREAAPGEVWNSWGYLGNRTRIRMLTCSIPWSRLLPRAVD